MADTHNENEAFDFYREVLQLIHEQHLPFLVGGAFALYHYTGIYRDTKDLDLFCKAEDYPKLLKQLSQQGYVTEVTDPRWLAKAFKGDYFVDIIFNTANNISPVDDRWFEHSVEGKLFDVPVRLISAEDMLWSKIYVQNRERYDGADVNHLLLRYGNHLDWKRVLARMEHHWPLLLSQLLNFMFVYPSDRDVIPVWLYEKLLGLAGKQFDLPAPLAKVCLGPLIDHTQYLIDIKDWHYKSFTTKTI